MKNVVTECCKGEFLIVFNGIKRLVTSSRREDIPDSEKVYIRLEILLTNHLLGDVLRRFQGDWLRDVFYPCLDNATVRDEYAVFRGSFVSGICYDDPPDGMNGIDVLHCGALDLMMGHSSL